MDNLNSYFPFLLTLTPLILFWQQSKNFVLKIFRMFWKERVIPYDFAYNFYEALSKESYVLNFDDYKIERVQYFSNEHQKHLPLLFKIFNFEIFFYKYCIPIFIYGGKDESIRIYYLKFTFNFEKFLINVIPKVYNQIKEETNKKIKENRFYVDIKRGKSLKLRIDSAGYYGGGGNLAPASSGNGGNNEGNKKYDIFAPYIFVNKRIQRTIGVNINDVHFDTPKSEKNKYIFTQEGKRVLGSVDNWNYIIRGYRFDMGGKNK